MKTTKRRNWTREETIVAFYVYCTIPFAQSSKSNPTIIKYANILGRSPSALNMKVGNIGRLDPDLKRQDISGLTHGSKMEEIVWEEFNENREKLVFEAEEIIADLLDSNMEDKFLAGEEVDYTGKEKERLIKTRVNQNFFRSIVLAAYDSRCAITGMSLSEFLIASHIKPWAKDKNNRLNPHNGICLNVLHDRAFDRGYITIDKNYKVVVSKVLKEHYSNNFVEEAFGKFAGKQILVPGKFKPSLEFLEYHNDVIFHGV